MTQEIRPILRTMQVGEQVTYPISRTSTVRTAAAIIALELDTLQFKRLTAFALQGIFKDKQEISLYGSNDATTWRFLGKTQRAAVNNITGRTYKYFRFVIQTSLTPEENISGLRLQYEIRREKRLR